MRRRQVAQSVSHVMLDHMSSTGVMRGDGRRRGEGKVKHEKREKHISSVHARYHNKTVTSFVISVVVSAVLDEWLLEHVTHRCVIEPCQNGGEIGRRRMQGGWIW